MRKIDFKKVTMKNFGPYIDEMYFSLDGNKMTIVSGANGIGKTMMFDSIPACLYGVTTKGMRGDDFVNNEVGKNCKISVEFDIFEDGILQDKYKVIRYQKYKKYGNTVLLYKNDFDTPIKKGHREVILEIENLILQKKMFFNSLFFGQGVKELFSDLEDSKKKEIFRKLLNLDIYENYKDETKNRLKELQAKVQINNDDISKHKYIVDSNKNQLIEYMSMEQTFQTEKENKIIFIKRAMEELKDQNIKIQKIYFELKKYIDENNKEEIYQGLQQIKFKIENCQKFLDEIKIKYENINKENIDKIDNEYNNLIQQYHNDAQNLVNQINDEFNKKIKENNNIHLLAISNINNKEDEAKNKFNKFIEQMQSKKILLEESKQLIDNNNDKMNNELNQNKLKYENENNKYNNELNENNNALNTNKLKIKEYDDNKKIIEDNVCNDSESRCPTCNSIITDEDIKNKLLSQIKEYNINIVNLDDNNNNIENYIKLLNTKIYSLSNENDKILKKYNDIKNKIDKEKEKIVEEYKLLQNDYENGKYKYDREIEENNENKNRIKQNQYDIDNHEELLYQDKIKTIFLNKKLKLNEYETTKSEKNSNFKSQSQNNQSEEKNNLEKELKSHEHDRIELENFYNLICEKNKEYDDFKIKLFDIKNKYLHLEKQLVDENKNEFGHYDKINKTKEDIKQLKIKLKEFDHESKVIEKRKKVLEFWNNAFSSSGIPSMLIDEAIPYMNERISYYMESLSDSRYVVSFDTLSETKSGEYRDKIQVNVYDSETKANNRVQLSGGQKRLIDIGTILTITDLHTKYHNVKFNFVIFDEIFDSLDKENINNTSNVLKKLSDDKSVFIISHQHTDEFDQMDCDEILKL